MATAPPRTSRPFPKAPDAVRGFALLGWVRLARNFLRFWAGYLASVRPAVRRGKLVVGDRGLYGYVVQPRELGFFGPARLAAAMVRLLPEPDMIVNLRAEPDMIAQRKQELSRDRIAAELVAWAQLPARRLRTFASDVAPERIAQQILAELDEKGLGSSRMASASDRAAELGLEPLGMRKPDFFFVGAAKAGTTSLFNYLIQHPSVFIPTVKEPHYFSEYPQPRAPVFHCVEDYLHLYSGCPDDIVAGDASTSYLYSRHAARRIFDLQPRAKIMIILRNPIDRAYSFYWHNRREFIEDLSFEKALEAEGRRIAENRPFRFHYVNSGRYYGQVKAYLDVFGRDLVRIYFFEDLLEDADSLCRDMFSFLGVSPSHPVNTDMRFNPSGPYRSQLIGQLLAPQFPARSVVRRLFPHLARRAKYHLLNLNVKDPPPMKPGTHDRLARFFEEDILKLQELVHRDLSHWLEPAVAPIPGGR